MGKTKPKRHRSKKQRPTGLPSVQEAEAEENEFAAAGTDTAIESQSLTLLEKLQSSSDEEKVCACTSLANLVQESAAREVLLQNGVVKSLGPLLLDSRLVIREAATGALRNLSACGEQEVCEKMVSDDVMTPLTALIVQYSNGIPDSQGSKAKRDPALTTLLQALHLLWNLCESSGTAVNIFNQHSLVNITLLCLQAHAAFIDLALTAAHCLQTVSEDNPGTAVELTKPTALPVLESALMSQGESMQNLLVRALAASILYNIKGHLPAVSQNQTIQAIVKVLCHALDTDVLSAISKLIPEMTQNGQVTNGSGAATEHELPDAELPKTLSDDLAEVEAALTAQQVALEVASNMCCTEDEDDDWEDMASSSSSSDDLQDDSTDMEEVPFLSPLCLSDEIHGALVSHNLPDKVLAKCAFPDRTMLQALVSNNRGKTLFKGLLRVQSRALLCLQNMIAVMDLKSLGGPEALTLVLDKLLALMDPAPAGAELVESLTSALRSVLQKMAACKHAPHALSEQHLTKLCALGQGTQSEQIRVNVVGMLGSIGSMLATKAESEQLLTAVGTQLTTVAMKDNSLWVTAEALDAIFDSFGDGEMADTVAVKIGLVSKLKLLVPQLKSRLRQGKNVLGEHLPVVINARHNLMRFIKYKESQ